MQRSIGRIGPLYSPSGTRSRGDPAATRRELNHIAPMLYKTIIAAFVVASGDALRIDGLKTRRAVIGTAASALSLAPLAAFAEQEKLKKASDAEIYARADDGKLKADKVLTLLSIQRLLACSTPAPATPCVASLLLFIARLYPSQAIERTKAGDLADGSSANCEELDALISVDRKAVDSEKKAGEDPKTREKLQAQINRLDGLRKDKGCASAGANLKQAGDFDVYLRADEGSLNSARVLQRAREGKLVDGTGASLNELSRIISIDKKAIQLEKEKIEALGEKASKEDKKTLEVSEKAIETQVKRLENLRRQKRLDKDTV